jgi:hypothetical protein
MWMFAQLDKIMFWCSGYMMIIKAKTCKETGGAITGALQDRESMHA